MYVYREDKDTVMWAMKVKPDISKTLDEMVKLFYKLGLISQPKRATFMKFCIQKTCRDVLSVLEEINIGKERNW